VEAESEVPKSTLIEISVVSSTDQDRDNGLLKIAMLRDRQSRLLVLQDNIYTSVVLRLLERQLQANQSQISQSQDVLNMKDSNVDQLK